MLRRKPLNLAIAPILAALAASPLQAAEGDTVEEIVVWGQETLQRAATSHPSSMLTQQDLVSINVATTEDVVKFEPSLVIRRRFIGDSNGTMGMRGSNMFQTSRSMVFADGVPLHYLLQTRWNGAPRWTMVSASEIAQVEVLYGPFSAEFSGNSMGGVVLIESAIPQRREFHFDSSFFSQNFNAYGFDDTVNGYKSFFSYGASWSETILGHFSVPQNAEPVDLDSDGDADIVVGTRGEQRLVFFENIGAGTLQFREHAIGINGSRAAGFNLEYTDLNGDGRLDIIGATPDGISWLAQPPLRIDDAWNAHRIGTFAPDTVTGMEIADINGDGLTDVLAGSYSSGDREEDDTTVGVNDELGRLGWFENPGLTGTLVTPEVAAQWPRHDISRRKRGMFDKFIARDMDGDGDMDFVGTRGNSYPHDGVFWLEQVRSAAPQPAFQRARAIDSPEMPLP